MTRALTFILSAMLAGACAGQSDDRVQYASPANASKPIPANESAESPTTPPRELSTQRTERAPRNPAQREPLSPHPNAPYPLPPQQQPPVPLDDPGTVDRVPQDPTTPETDELGRPDPMRD
ncbi:MAG: hypothetical protein H0T42_21680 [Deltaproteobacteria bacterium]|nr:hypothetical protein [Deltaproteobacteria bacterium]